MVFQNVVAESGEEENKPKADQTPADKVMGVVPSGPLFPILLMIDIAIGLKLPF